VAAMMDRDTLGAVALFPFVLFLALAWGLA
jgi:hypothetical protein